MDIGSVKTTPHELACAKGVFVADLHGDDMEALDTGLDKLAKEDVWERLRLKAHTLLRDGDGNHLEGMATAEELRGKISRGRLADMIGEAEEVLVLGKRLMTKLPQPD